MGETPLMWASGDFATRALLKASAAPAVQSKSGKTALMSASSRGHLTVVEVLVATPGVDLNTIDAKGSSAYALANGMGYVDICKFLSEHGAESTAETVAQTKLVPRSAALHEAVRQGHSEACAVYIKECQACEINAKIGGETP